MSSGAKFVGLEGQKPATSPEKPGFSGKCSLFSQYLKEKGSFGDLSLGMTCNMEANGNGMPDMLGNAATTMNLFPVIEEKSCDVQTRSMGSLRSSGPMDLFPQQAGFTSLASKEDVQKNIDSSDKKSVTSEAQTAQMTIFYAGKVIVFDNFPADKAKEVMLLASSRGSSTSHKSSPPALDKSYPAFAPNIAKTPSESSSSVPPSSNAIPSFGNGLVQEHVQPPPQPIAGDLPIARRVSLHRFLERRKDRITSKAPYQTSGPSVALSKPAESNSWLGLAAQSQH
uniref:Protein TIFY n=1 Tax=Rhizophora mucronata TaxID=61149 RepID=A0A2P2QN94_RHIMU